MHATPDSKDGHNAEKAKESFLDPEKYLEHLLEDGSLEGDSGEALELPPWFDEQLFKR